MRESRSDLWSPRAVSVMSALRIVIVLCVAVVGLAPTPSFGEWWCGPTGSSLSDLIPDKPRVAIFNRIDLRGTCMRHDVCYGVLGNSKDFCDQSFFDEIRKKCGQQFAKVDDLKSCQ